MNVAQLEKNELVDLIVQQSERIAMLEQQLRLLLSKTYGSTSEKISSDQLALFAPELIAQVDRQDETEQDAETISATVERKPRGKRKSCDKDLERHRVDYELSTEERHCSCGSELQKIGEVSSEQFDIIPTRYIVIQHVQHKYACPCCKSTIKVAPKAIQPLPKTNAAAGLLAHIATTKFVDGVPLHRQEIQHQRGGIELPRNTMARWLIQLSDLVLVLINLMEDAIRAGPYIQCDETPLQVLKEVGRKATTQSYIWVRRGGMAGQEVVLYNYFPSRSSQVVLSLFEDYHGFVQCDGYAAYNVLEKQGITLIGCMAHARRKYSDALKSLTSKESAQKSKAATAIKFIKRLYAIETELKGQPADYRHDVRQERSIPILAEFKDWLDSQVVLPKSPLGKAINYTCNQWHKLIRYCHDGRLEIDNNQDERAIRPLAIGRRNWLFADTPKGAHTNARFYSLIETCKLHGHEPYAYLKYIFKELPSAGTVEHYEALLPWNLDGETVKQRAREI